MKKKNQTVKKLSLNKTQLTKVNNMFTIRGGNDATNQVNPNNCDNQENGSKPAETIFQPTK